MRHESISGGAGTSRDFDLVAALTSDGPTLSQATTHRVRGLGSRAIPLLLDVVDDDTLFDSEGPGEGWAPVHAATLLGALRAQIAIPRLLRALKRRDWTTALHEEILRVLVSMGHPVVEPALTAHRSTADLDFATSLRALLRASAFETTGSSRFSSNTWTTTRWRARATSRPTAMRERCPI